MLHKRIAALSLREWSNSFVQIEILYKLNKCVLNCIAYDKLQAFGMFALNAR